ncbi:glycosyltransferase family 4 protein [Neobacillus cucumis]|uniref:glycosyltransferase family 4 protein n=1 Tax=Neobacillus cucumis TaxID=1740721 RepID=UPI0028530BA5|nr:glycosyltransferase family 4 protein [Neobacillus cucumis]MDR4949067.1 glycosyltransferase family 4 protein [Neobacillus cucumis]
MLKKNRDILLVAPFTILPGEKGFNRFTYIGEKLSDKGHNVTLLTSNFKHSDKQFRNKSEIQAISSSLKYKIVMIDELGYQRNIGIDRIKSHNYFSKQLALYLKHNRQKPDVIYCAYPMMEAAFIVGKFAKKYKIPFVMDIQDVWPEAIKNAIPLPERLVDLLLYPFTIYANKIYSLADYVVGVSKSYVQRVSKANLNARSYLPIFIGTDLGVFDLNKEKEVKKDPTEFWITYIGTLSYSYDLETVIRAVSILKNKGYCEIKFKVFGSGPLQFKFETLSKQLGAPVDFMGHFKYEDMISYLVNSNVAANAISKGAQQSITNKIGDYLSAGLPILNSSQNPEFMDMVTTKGIGYNYNPGDAIKLADLIEHLYINRDLCTTFGKNARRLAEEKFDRRNSYGEIYLLIEQATV